MNRTPAVAGSFYPGGASKLKQEVERHLIKGQPKRPAYGALIPHAGYMYSGDIAGEVFSRLEIPDTVLILNPNHTGAGVPLAVWPKGNWITPLGEVPVDEELVAELIQANPGLTPDESAHTEEHSGEVMLPFLQVLKPDVRIVVVTVAVGRLEALVQFGQGIAAVLKKRAQHVLIIASSDMTHFESEESAKTRDHLAIAPMLRLDERELFRVVRNEGITMCGISPATAMISAVKALGATQAELVKYDTSATAGGDTARVVGYAGIIFS